MTEEKANGVQNGEAATPEETNMAPQEDTSKVPLADDGPAQVAFKANKEEKIEIGEGKERSGLTKDELEAYANDPMWIKLRWSLFILFWLGWLGMLVAAIVIVVQAPQCPPAPTHMTIQESQIIEISTESIPELDMTDMNALLDQLGPAHTIYIPGLVDPNDINNFTPGLNVELITNFTQGVDDMRKYVSTDFLPANMDIDMEKLKAAMDTWLKRGVSGFFTKDDFNIYNETIAELNNYLQDQPAEGSMVTGKVVVQDELTTLDGPNLIDFLEEYSDEDYEKMWTYYQYNPVATGTTVLQESLDLLTIVLMSVPGTPILTNLDCFENDDECAVKRETLSVLLKKLDELREEDSIMFGDYQMVNGTDTDVVAFTRMMKGNPGYAVAVNLGPTNATVSFTNDGVPDEGTYFLRTTNLASESKDRTGFNKLKVNSMEGFIIKFVPDID